jgi:hypothetical protein
MQKWLAGLDTQWQAAFNREVCDVHDAELGKLWVQYLDSIIAAGVANAVSGDLSDAVALRNEHKRFSDEHEVPAQDDAGDPPSVTQLRARWRAQIAQLEKERASRAKSLHAEYDQILAKAQATLTQRRRVADALVVKVRREEIAAAWLTTKQQGIPPIYTDAQIASLLSTALAGHGIPPIRAPADVTEPTAPARKFLFGTQPGTDRAKVDVQEMNLEPLAKDGKLWSDREVRLLNIPARFKYYQFTQATAYVTTLCFTVLTDGLVYLGCSTRRRTTETPEMPKVFATAESLKKDGWTPVLAGEITTTSKGLSLEIYSRLCKAGEVFSYCTEMHSPPILLLK